MTKAKNTEEARALAERVAELCAGKKVGVILDALEMVAYAVCVVALEKKA